MRVPRSKLPDGSVGLIEPPWAGELSSFTMLFEVRVLSICREMPFAAVARLVGESCHQVAALAERYVELAGTAFGSVTFLSDRMLKESCTFWRE